MSNYYYVKKPTIVKAIQWTGDNYEEVTKFLDVFDDRMVIRHANLEAVAIYDGDRRYICHKDEYIISDVDGDITILSSGEFRYTYEKLGGI